MATPAPTPIPTSIFEPETYSTSSEVENLHGSFGSDFSYNDTDYATHLTWVGIGVFVIGWTFMSVMWCTNFFAMFKGCRTKCNSCYTSAVCDGNTGRYLIILILILAAITVSASYAGYSELKDAVMKLVDVIDELANILYSMEDEAVDMKNQINAYNTTARQTSCQQTVLGSTVTFDLSDYFSVASFAPAANALVSLFDGVPELFEKAGGVVEDEAPDAIAASLSVVVFLYWLLVFFAMVAVMTKCKCDDRLVMFFGSFSMVSMLILVCVEVSISVALADFCYAGPDEVIYQFAQDELDQDSASVVRYYTTCIGDNPVQDLMRNITRALNGMDKTIDEYENDCTGSGISDISGFLVDSVDSIDTMVELVSCENIQPLYAQIFYVMMCENMVNGLSILWIVQVASSLLIWFSFLTIPCATYQPEDVNDTVSGKVQVYSEGPDDL